MNVEAPCLIRPPAGRPNGMTAALLHAMQIDRALPVLWLRLLARLDRSR